MSERIIAILVLALLSVLPRTGLADWGKVKGYLNSEATVVHESKERLVIRHPHVEATITITVGRAPDSDIYSALALRRGGNPYRVWVVQPALWSGAKIPRKQWGRFFRTSFLRILRAPPRP